jgi:hypothetical protein
MSTKRVIALPRLSRLKSENSVWTQAAWSWILCLTQGCKRHSACPEQPRVSDSSIYLLRRWESMNKTYDNQVSVVHACNPSYSGGRDQEDRDLKPAQANSSWDPIKKKKSQKRAGSWLMPCLARVKPWVQMQSHQKKKSAAWMIPVMIDLFHILTMSRSISWW